MEGLSIVPELASEHYQLALTAFWRNGESTHEAIDGEGPSEEDTYK